MARTRVFKSGNSQAVRIPAEIAYTDTDTEFEITRLGDVITICPAPRGAQNAWELLRKLPKPPPEIREPIEVPDHEGS